jgi:hypothetical protein
MHALAMIVSVLNMLRHPLVAGVIFLICFLIFGVVYAFKRSRDR